MTRPGKSRVGKGGFDPGSAALETDTLPPDHREEVGGGGEGVTSQCTECVGYLVRDPTIQTEREASGNGHRTRLVCVLAVQTE